MKASNLKSKYPRKQRRLAGALWPARDDEHVLYTCQTVTSIPVLRVKSEAEAATDASCPPLPLEGTGFRNKGLHQRTHLAALMVPECHIRLKLSLYSKIFVSR